SLRSKWLLGDGFGIAQSIELLGRAAAIAGESERAAHFTGAAHRAWREFGRHGFGSRHYREREREAAAQARGDLGDEAYEAAYREGYGMSVDDAVAYALGADQASPVPPPAWRDTPPAAPVLTPRQLQVAELIAAGLSNRQIANRLVISE